MQTHLVSKIMHQNFAIILWQFNYGKNSFIVFGPRSRGSFAAFAMQNFSRGATWGGTRHRRTFAAACAEKSSGAGFCWTGINDVTTSRWRATCSSATLSTTTTTTLTVNFAAKRSRKSGCLRTIIWPVTKVDLTSRLPATSARLDTPPGTNYTKLFAVTHYAVNCHLLGRIMSIKLQICTNIT